VIERDIKTGGGKMEEIKKIANFLLEIAVLKGVKRAGWRNAGVTNPDSVAEHVFLTAQIAYILGKMEGINAERAAMIALFHDNGEARTGDLNLVAKLYLKDDEAEEKAFFDQIEELPAREEIGALYKEWKEQRTKEAIVARDADLLEGVIQAKCYIAGGNRKLEIWIEYWGKKLKTVSAKRLFEAIKNAEIDEWWKEIPQIKSEIEKIEK
jgi:putative hydrolase of HD superfamily